jgi:acetylcholinesterase
MHEHQFEEFLALLNCQSVPEGEVMHKLRSLSTADIKQASEAIFTKYNPSVRWPWQPVIDGAGGMIPIPPIDAWKAGKWHRIPILTGYNTNEGAGFVPQTMDASKQFTEFFHTLLPGLSTADLKVLNEVYPDPLLDPKSIYRDTRPDPTIGAEFKRAEQAYGHFAYVAPVKHTAHFAANSGKTPGKPIYLYQFGVNSSMIYGAAHGSNGWFPSYVEKLRQVSDSLEEVSGSMHAYWTRML